MGEHEEPIEPPGVAGGRDHHGHTTAGWAVGATLAAVAAAVVVTLVTTFLPARDPAPPRDTGVHRTTSATASFEVVLTPAPAPAPAPVPAPGSTDQGT